ncbi:hypothetical protein NIES593_19335 [Hydrococcus rivularis NIES-593]|uniref:Uncharacterized protein n=1 Tax=Hydrococcus rivularis NIES-593 TaxID=1921803 RepID=A0A1U7H9N1_9CYAN|nr:hypothetical protein [Hydrococcus rivularis]OKH20264.1 hypothetical protein NIES593_19335 [Hydrococcus rivularis NIES-593]
MSSAYSLFKLDRAFRVCEAPSDETKYHLKIAPLDETEKVRLQELEAIVAQGLQTFYEVGQALIEIRDRKLYGEPHKTFEAYCKEKWSLTKRRAYQFMNASAVIQNLCTMVHKFPTSERQVRPLTKLPPAQQLEIWQKAVEESPNGTPTAKIVERLVKEQENSTAKKKPLSEVEQLRQENEHLKEELKRQAQQRERRAALVAAELEQLREENRQLKAELRQRDLDWEVRLAVEREKIRAEVEAQMEAKYRGIIDWLTAQLAEMTAKYEAVLARLEAIEGAKE